MSAADWLQLAILIALLARDDARCSAPTSPRSSAAATAPGDRVFCPIERLVYRVCGVDPEREQRWTVYALSLLAFSARLGARALRAAAAAGRRCRSTRPTSARVPPALAFNTAVSFVTNTNWQSYAGESTMSHLTQMAGSPCRTSCRPPSGMAVAVALIRGLVAPAARRRSATSGSTSRGRSSRILLRSRSCSRSCS